MIAGKWNTDDCLCKIYLYMMKRYGTLTADREFEPLKWYVNTGRASVTFIKKLIAAKPFMVARILHKMGCGNYDLTITAVKEYIGCME